MLRNRDFKDLTFGDLELALTLNLLFSLIHKDKKSKTKFNCVLVEHCQTVHKQQIKIG